MAEEKVWLAYDNGTKVVTLTEARLDKALKLMRDCYYTDESASRALELQVRF
jgi:hypothetical protein